MANWSELKAAVASIVKTNGNKEITGQLLQNVLNNIISNVGLNSTFAGIATPETNPGTPDGNVFYLATTEGTYSNFNGIVINSGESVILEWKGSWSKKTSGFATQENFAYIGSLTYPTLNFIGEDNTQVVKYVRYLVPGRKYRLYIHNPNVEIYETGVGYKLSVKTANASNNIVTSLIEVMDDTELRTIYDFEMPNDETSTVRIGVRCKAKEQFPISIQDVSYLYEDKISASDFEQIKDDINVLESYISTLPIFETYVEKLISTSGSLTENVNYSASSPIELKKGQTLELSCVNNNGGVISETDKYGSYYINLVKGLDSTLQTYRYTATKDCYVAISWRSASADINSIVIKEKVINNKSSYMNPTQSIEGDNSTPVSIYFNGLIPGHAYRVYVHNPNIEISSGTVSSTYRFVINTADSNKNNITDLHRIYASYTGALRDSYDFEMPNDGTSTLRISARCRKGDICPISIQDITSLASLENNLSDAYAMLNFSQMKNGYRLYDSSATEDVASSYFLTPFIPTLPGDAIEVYSGFISDEIRFASYDKDKNYLGSYAYSQEVRKVTFNNENVVYTRYTFKLDNIGAYVKINGRVAFEWTQNLHDMYFQYIKTEKYSSSVLLRRYILCDGNVTTAGETIENILPNHTYRVYLEDLNPPTEGWCADNTFKFSIRSLDTNDANTTLLTIYGSNEFKPYYDVNTPRDAKKLYLRARSEPGYKFYFHIEDITSNEGKNLTNILAANPQDEFMPKFQSAKKRYYTSTDTTKKQPIVIAHLSDIHSNWVNVQRFIAFTDYWKDYIDIKVNTGDTVIGMFSDGFEGYNSLDNVGSIINVIGNHDTRKDEGDVVDWQGHKGLDIYNILIKPFVSNWGVVQPENADTNGYCYFYKDFAENLLRIVFVDIMAYDEVEDNWLSNVLSDALTIGYDVLIATHFSGVKSDNSPVFNSVKCNYTTLFRFSSEDSSSSLSYYNSKAYLMNETVQSFINNGGLFCGYIQGHYHADFIAKNYGYEKQLIYSIGATKAGEMRDYNHIVGTRNQDEFQIISVDTYLKVVKLYKVGANVDLYGRHKNSTCINYVTGEIVAESY